MQPSFPEIVPEPIAPEPEAPPRDDEYEEWEERTSSVYEEQMKIYDEEEKIFLEVIFGFLSNFYLQILNSFQRQPVVRNQPTAVSL